MTFSRTKFCALISGCKQLGHDLSLLRLQLQPDRSSGGRVLHRPLFRLPIHLSAFPNPGEWLRHPTFRAKIIPLKLKKSFFALLDDTNFWKRKKFFFIKRFYYTFWMTTLLKVVIQNFAEKIWPNFFIRINFLIGIFSMKLSLKKKVPASFSVLETRQLVNKNWPSPTAKNCQN